MTENYALCRHSINVDPTEFYASLVSTPRDFPSQNSGDLRMPTHLWGDAQRARFGRLSGAVARGGLRPLRNPVSE